MNEDTEDKELVEDDDSSVGNLSVKCNWEVSSTMDFLGGNDGGKAPIMLGNLSALGVISQAGPVRLLLEADEGGDGDAGTRSCAKCGIVEMRGESAQGFVEDVRSCSSVGSITLYNNHGVCVSIMEVTVPS